MFLKVCCIQNLSEARQAAAAGAAALGLVSAMPSGPGVISEDAIEGVLSNLELSIETFLLTSHSTACAILDQHRRLPTTALQLVDRLDGTAEYERLRLGAPNAVLVQVIHVLDDSSVEEAIACAPHVDRILLDSGNPRLAVKELGGTGRVHDWTLSRAIRDAVRIPVILAGGLRAENVGDAIAAVRPFGVDVCSGVRVDGRLDSGRLGRFAAAVAAAS
jgi:phosphoribosylanthranilate isomerase